jgi:hypothetical protein
MTPKEKAEGLVNSFYNNAESRNKIGAFDEDLHKYNCKQCALIAVKEMLTWFKAHSYSNKNYDAFVFYNEVKQEIEKL